MRVLPSQSFSFVVPGSAAEVLARLTAAVEPKSWFRNPFSSRHRPFEGTATAGGFKLTRVIHYGNSWLPTIVGKFTETADGTRVDVLLRLTPVARVWMTVWLGGVAILGGALIVSPTPEGQSAAWKVVPVLMFAAGYQMMRYFFSLEARKATALLTSLFNASTRTP